MAAGLAFVVVKKMTGPKPPKMLGGYGQQPGRRDVPGMGSLGGMFGGGGGGGGFGQPPPYGSSGGGAAASFFGGGGGGGTRDINGGAVGGYGGPPGPDYNAVLRTLHHCIQEQHIAQFYPDPRAVDAIAQRIVANQSVQTISQEWQLTPDIAIDLCKLALFDIVVLCDDSAAMRGEQGGERINDLRE